MPRHNPDIFADLFPEKSAAEHEALAEEKEARFRKLASRALEPLPGLRALTAALARRGVRRAAVTNAPRANVRARTHPCSFSLADSFIRTPHATS
jgi:phosphoglycolate phosphatase-like HAD superfamily hydrolase